MTRLLGLDLGGTNIKLTVVEDVGGARCVVGTDAVPTLAERGPVVVIERLAAAGQLAIERWGPVERGGVGVPGLFDAGTGVIELFPNLPGPWSGQSLRDPLAEALGVSMAIVNDCRAFTLAETRLGAAVGCSTVICLALGTGIGGGVVVDGRLHTGPHGRAGEIGHQIVVVDGPPCGCGNRGCVEAVANVAALTAAAGLDDAEEVFSAARRGDERARSAIREIAGHLAVGIANMLTVLVPERVVIGGGVADAGDLLFEPLREEVRRRCVLIPPEWYEIVPAELGPYAGAIGAALWAGEAELVDDA
jgi:glucokinase